MPRSDLFMYTALEVPLPPQGRSGGGAVEERREWRSHFARSLRGEGLQLAARTRPFRVAEKVRLDFADQFSVPELRSLLPDESGQRFVEPHIIDSLESLSSLPSGRYDFVVADRIVEQLANPLKAVQSWLRILKPSGSLLLAVADKRFSPEQHRPRTTVEHLIFDFYHPSKERDFEHYLEDAQFVRGLHGEEAIKHARAASKRRTPIALHAFCPEDVVAALDWLRGDLAPLDREEGPVKSPHGEEFFVLLRKG